jgi:hypothetical protein
MASPNLEAAFFPLKNDGGGGALFFDSKIVPGGALGFVNGTFFRRTDEMNVPMPIEPALDDVSADSSRRCREVIDAIPVSVFADSLKYRFLEVYYQSVSVNPDKPVSTIIREAHDGFNRSFSSTLEGFVASKHKTDSAVELVHAYLIYSAPHFVESHSKLLDQIGSALRCEETSDATGPILEVTIPVTWPAAAPPPEKEEDRPSPTLTAARKRKRTVNRQTPAVAIASVTTSMRSVVVPTTTKRFKVSTVESARLYVALCTALHPASSLLTFELPDTEHGTTTFDDFIMTVEEKFTHDVFVDAGKKFKSALSDVVAWTTAHATK